MAAYCFFWFVIGVIAQIIGAALKIFGVISWEWSMILLIPIAVVLGIIIVSAIVYGIIRIFVWLAIGDW